MIPRQAKTNKWFLQLSFDIGIKLNIVKFLLCVLGFSSLHPCQGNFNIDSFDSILWSNFNLTQVSCLLEQEPLFWCCVSQMNLPSRAFGSDSTPNPVSKSVDRDPVVEEKTGVIAAITECKLSPSTAFQNKITHFNEVIWLDLDQAR